jgi:hypothetical protein
MDDERILTAQDQRVVTPEDPLFIDENKVVFHDVVIEGGWITAQVETDTTFIKLTKQS